ncbi:hypothetical protein AB0F03_19785 [Streptomyces sp. NPDC028722]|uniref:hypothetical protein n=1 Tax=Streptomyces sp. NPDC028722 TaxID=3155016 RepID=UPI0033CD5F64
MLGLPPGAGVPAVGVEESALAQAGRHRGQAVGDGMSGAQRRAGSAPSPTVWSWPR